MSEELEDHPIQVGVLNKVVGFNYFKKCLPGHPVYELNNRYIIYIESIDGKFTQVIPYYKETLMPAIDFNIT